MGGGLNLDFRIQSNLSHLTRPLSKVETRVMVACLTPMTNAVWLSSGSRCDIAG